MSFTELDGTTVHTYAYDALGRRIERVNDAGGTPVTTRYIPFGDRVVEERDASGTVQATYVYGEQKDTHTIPMQ